jgi:deoxyribose-phosphate aldolase
MIDHTLLRPDATDEQIRRLCEEARLYRFASVCINPCHVSRCAELLRGSDIAVCTVIAFPLGATSTRAKVAEAEQALSDGANELDMVMNIGLLKSGRDDDVGHDIRSVVQAAQRNGALTKVILENALLTDEEKVRACQLAVRAGADFVKTSTGFAHGGATLADVDLMRRTVGPTMGIKAAGGIRTYEEAVAFIEHGANRIGTSSGVAIVTKRTADRTKGY